MKAVPLSLLLWIHAEESNTYDESGIYSDERQIALAKLELINKLIEVAERDES